MWCKHSTWYKFWEWNINKKLLNGDRRLNLLWLYKKYLKGRLIDLQSIYVLIYKILFFSTYAYN